MKNAISWFEIPASDLERATKFYESIFDLSLIPLDLGEFQMRMFPIEDMMDGVGGALVYSPGLYKSSASDGVLIYLNGSPDLQVVLDRVETAGGKIIMPKTEIAPEYGFSALFVDTEGNRIGLHSGN